MSYFDDLLWNIGYENKDKVYLNEHKRRYIVFIKI